MKKDNKLKIAITLNIIIAIIVVIALLLMYFNIKFMSGYDFTDNIQRNEMLKYFTIESNIFMAIMAVVFAIDEIKILKGKIKEISLTKYVFKLVSTACVALTLTVVLVWLGPTTKGGLKAVIMNSNLFFHLIIPLLSIIVFTIFEKTNKMSFKHTLYGLIPLAVYGLIYMPNIITHIHNGKVSAQYDYYNYFQKGVLVAVIAFTVQYIVMYLITCLLWKFNKKTK